MVRGSNALSVRIGSAIKRGIMEELKRKVLREMVKLYTMFCMPRLVYVKGGAAMTIEYLWTNTEAEKLYQEYGVLLKELKV